LLVVLSEPLLSKARAGSKLVFQLQMNFLGIFMMKLCDAYDILLVDETREHIISRVKRVEITF